MTNPSPIQLVLLISTLAFSLTHADEPNFESTTFEIWTSTSGIKMEARLVGITNKGDYVLRTKDGKDKTVPLAMLNESSRKRALEFGSVEPSEVTFFGVSNKPGNGNSTPGNSTTTGNSTTGNSTTTGNSSTTDYIGTVWQGESPFEDADGVTAKITFESAKSLRWESTSKEFTKRYRLLTDKHFTVKRGKNTIINFRMSDNGSTMWVKINDIGSDKGSVFTKITK